MKNKCYTCFNPIFDDLIYKAKFTIDEAASNIAQSLEYGYSCDKRAESKAKRLNSYLEVLEDEYRKLILGGQACLSDTNLQKLAEKVRSVASFCNTDNRKDLIVDKSGVDSWIANNPYCVSRERWEALAYTICEKLNLEVSIENERVCEDLSIELFGVEKVCDITFELVRSIIPCDIVIALSAYEHNCNLGLDVSRTEHECSLDFNILSSEVNCDLDLKTYSKLVDCNLSFDIIRTVYENDCSFEINDSAEVSLVTPLNTYPINKFKFKGIPDINALEELGVDTSDSEYKKNPEKFIQKLNQDYGESKH